jgi:hypothetical protein
MASVAAICNLAFAHFGHDANVITIDPPGSSIEEQLCQNFYPIARDELLELHAWDFASKRATLTQLVSTREDFAYAYALPGDCLKPRKLLPEGYASDSESEVFELEDNVLYTDVPTVATLVYTYKLTSTARFTPLFTSVLALRLASYLAGPILKDATGRVQTLLMQRALALLGQARASAANRDTKRSTHTSTARAAR